MVEWVKDAIRRRPFSAAALALAVAVVLGVGTFYATGWLRVRTLTARIAATTRTAGSETRDVSWSFAFEDSTCTVTIPVREVELEAARGIDTSEMFVSRGWLRERFVTDLVKGQSRSTTVEALATETRRLRDEMGLDPDRYLELMVRAVQVVPYGEIERRVKLPIETVADGAGVCTEKSILLAALLVHEGYDSVVWVFETQRHVAVGVASNGAGFKGTGYAFIETTQAGYIGQVEPTFRSVGPVAKRPQQISLGGTSAYGAGAETEAILRILWAAESSTSATEGYRYYAQTALGPWRDEYARKAEEHEAAAALARYILDNSHRRTAVYEALVDTPEVSRRGGVIAR